MAVEYKPGEYRDKFDDTLLPCPFCGARAFAAPSGSVGAVIRCGKCSARTVSDFGRDEAAKQWNARDQAEANERDRCAKIAETEADEYQRQINAHNNEMMRLYPSPSPVPDYFRERGVYLHAKESASRNLAGLIRTRSE